LNIFSDNFAARLPFNPWPAGMQPLGRACSSFSFHNGTFFDGWSPLHITFACSIKLTIAPKQHLSEHHSILYPSLQLLRHIGMRVDNLNP
jgi:hypothetical protein